MSSCGRAASRNCRVEREPVSAVESHRRWDCFRILFEGPSALWASTRLGGSMMSWINWQARWRSAIQNSHTICRGAYDYWFTHFVDKEFGEVWNSVDGRTHAPVAPKQWEWKNAY